MASRYRADFEEVEFLGKGGFGSVVKARNRIDGRFYAIKKIKLDPRDNEGSKKIFREVTTLSRLHHQNIVRYYTTWVEDYDTMEAAGGMGGIPEESESVLSSDDESSDLISLGLSHSSWSTEQRTSSSSSSSSSRSDSSGELDGASNADANSASSSDGSELVYDSDDGDDDLQICFASPSRSEASSNNVDSSATGITGSERLYSDETNNEALDALNPRVIDNDILAPGKSGRRASNVFSAIRFGTMRTGGADDASGQRDRPPRAVMLKTYGRPVREFATASATEEEEDYKSSSDGRGDMLLHGQKAQQRQMLRAKGDCKQSRSTKEAQEVEKGKRNQKKHLTSASAAATAVAQPKRSSQILYIQMEYCENKTLSDMIREGLDEKACWRLFGQILEGLHHIHERSVIHRDLKPVNAFLDGAGD
ncbi:eukaryotic translation initiation factor 2-alpha kinase, partial [Coemansia sp. RSA 2559]